MVESALKYGPFDGRYPARPKLPAPSWDLRPDGDGAERLDWSAFPVRFFPNGCRHDFAALAAYEADRNTLAVASTRVPVVASSSAVLTWESEGGASAERPAG